MDCDRHQEQGSMQEVHSGMWMEGSPYQSHQQSPLYEFNGFAFSPVMDPSVGSNNMGPPRTGAPMLQPLVTTPMTPWPSMLASQSNYGTPMYHSPPQATTPQLPTPMSAPPLVGRSHDRPRKTLTDQDRRRMCEYAEQNPTVKQTEIGALFGVERSTVSKVLRNKEKYLSQDETAKDKATKLKGKFPDIERTLSNWVKNEKKSGVPISDDQIMEKFKHFAQTVKDSDSHLKSVNQSWLEVFKQKNGLTPKSRKNSVANDSDSKGSLPSGAQTPNISPTSPQIKREASPAGRGPAKKDKERKKMKSESPPAGVEMSSNHRPYASISGELTNAVNGAFTSAPMSPSMSFFSNPNPFDLNQGVQHLQQANVQHRPRSQTFPIATSGDNGTFTPTSDMHSQGFLSSIPSADESPADMLPLVTSPDGFLPTPGFSKEDTGSPDLYLQASSPMLPDAATSTAQIPNEALRGAIDTLSRFFEAQHSIPGLDENEVAVVNRLMKKVRLQTGGLPGGMHPINEQMFHMTRTTAD